MENVELKAGDVLLIVDVQQDFLPPEGALKVPGGDEIIPVLNSWIGRFSKLGLLLWHPETGTQKTTVPLLRMVEVGPGTVCRGALGQSFQTIYNFLPPP